MVTVTEGRSFSFAAARDLADASIFGNAFKVKQPTLTDVQCSTEILSSPFLDLDGVTGGVQSLISFIENATVKVYEINLGTVILRAFVVLDSIEIAAAVEDLVGVTLSMQGASQRNARSWSVST